MGDGARHRRARARRRMPTGSIRACNACRPTSGAAWSPFRRRPRRQFRPRIRPRRAPLRRRRLQPSRGQAERRLGRPGHDPRRPRLGRRHDDRVGLSVHRPPPAPRPDARPGPGDVSRHASRTCGSSRWCCATRGAGSMRPASAERSASSRTSSPCSARAATWCCRSRARRRRSGIVDGRLLVSLDEPWEAAPGLRFATDSVVSYDLDEWKRDPVRARPSLVWAPGPRQTLSGLATTRNTLLLTTLDNVRGRAFTYNYVGRRLAFEPGPAAAERDRRHRRRVGRERPGDVHRHRLPRRRPHSTSTTPPGRPPPSGSRRRRRASTPRATSSSSSRRPRATARKSPIS